MGDKPYSSRSSSYSSSDSASLDKSVEMSVISDVAISEASSGNVTRL